MRTVKIVRIFGIVWKRMMKMKCKECNLCWADKGEEFPSCKADPNWPAPCEYDDNYDDEDKYDDDEYDWD